MRDGILELWLRLLALHVQDPATPETIVTKIRDQWLLASPGFFNGCIPDGLEDPVSTPEGHSVVHAAIHSLLEALKAAPPRLNRDVFNVMGFTNGEFTTDVETWRLVEVGHAYLRLLDGTMTTGASDTAVMRGCREQKRD
jgi:hypothetical protein